MGHRLQDPLDFLFDRGGRYHGQASAHRLRGTLQQVSQEFDRKVDPKPEQFRQFVVGFGMRHHAAIAGIGKARTGVSAELVDHRTFAAIDDHVGDDLRQVGAARNGEQMSLSLAPGDLDEGAGGQTV